MADDNNDAGNNDAGNNDAGNTDAGNNDAGNNDTPLGWRDKLPEDIRSLPTLDKFKDETEMVSMPINVARSYITAEQLIGRDKIPVPKSPEEWDEVYKRLGKPESSELYVLPIDEALDPNLKKMVTEDATWFRGKAHELGLSEKQATDLFSTFTEHTLKNFESKQQMGSDEKINAETQLRAELGTAYDGKMILASRAVQEFGGEELVKILNATGVGNHPSVIRAFMKIGGMIAEDLGLDKDTGLLSHSKETLQDQITTLQMSPEYVDASNPAHIASVAKVAKLMETLHGTKPIGR